MENYELALNIALLIACYIYVLACIVLCGKASSFFGFSNKSSRKLLHVTIGNLPFLIPLFTLDNFPLNFPFFVAAPFIIVTLLASPSVTRGLSQRLSGLTGIAEHGHHLGLVYYAISYTLLALFFASRPCIIAAGVLPMAYGDASAAIIGQKYGNTKYRVLALKSLEGSVAMFCASFLILEVSFVFFSALYGLSFLTLTLAALAVASIVTLVEAVTPKGFDNITVPLVGALIFLLVFGGI